MFIIQTSAGTICFEGKTFKTFEDGWAFLYEHYQYDPESQDAEFWGEFYVVPVIIEENK